MYARLNEISVLKYNYCLFLLHVIAYEHREPYTNICEFLARSTEYKYIQSVILYYTDNDLKLCVRHFLISHSFRDISNYSRFFLMVMP